MAEGRMLKKRISKSHKFATLKSHNARLLYLMMYPHLDIKGRIDADPKLIKGEIVPLLNFSQTKIWDYLEDMNSVGLIKLYKTNSQWYLEATKFIDFQSLRPSHEAESQCPDPITGELPTNNSSSTAKVKESKVKQSKVKLKESKYSEQFNLFWKKFEGRWNAELSKHDKGSKLLAFEEWEKLSLEDQRKAWTEAKRHRGKAVPDACRWLSNRRFEDFD